MFAAVQDNKKCKHEVNVVSPGCAAEVWPPPFSCCIRLEGRVRSSRSERTAGVIPERRGGRQAAASDPPEQESLPARYLRRRAELLVQVLQVKGQTEWRQRSVII